MISSKIEYDKSGNVIRETDYDGDGQIWYNTEYSRDSKGRMLEWVHYDSYGKVSARGKCTNADDKEWKLVNCDSDGNEYGEILFTYDHNGNILSQTLYYYEDEK